MLRRLPLPSRRVGARRRPSSGARQTLHLALRQLALRVAAARISRLHALLLQCLSQMGQAFTCPCPNLCRHCHSRRHHHHQSRSFHPPHQLPSHHLPTCRPHSRSGSLLHLLRRPLHFRRNPSLAGCCLALQAALRLLRCRPQPLQLLRRYHPPQEKASLSRCWRQAPQARRHCHSRCRRQRLCRILRLGVHSSARCHFSCCLGSLPPPRLVLWPALPHPPPALKRLL